MTETTTTTTTTTVKLTSTVTITIGKIVDVTLHPSGIRFDGPARITNAFISSTPGPKREDGTREPILIVSLIALSDPANRTFSRRADQFADELDAPKRIRVRGLTATATWTIDDQFPDESHGHNLLIGTTFVEGTAEDLLEAASRVRDSEVHVFFNSDKSHLEDQAIKNAEAARIRWATKIERAVERAQR